MPDRSMLPMLARRPHPGNQGSHEVERPVPPDDLIARLAPSGRPLGAARQELLDAFERAYVAKLLRRFGGNVTRAAAQAGITRRHLHRLKTKHQL